MKEVQVECELFGALQRNNPENKFSLKLKPQTTYRQLLTDYLHFNPQHLRYLIVVSNDQQITDFSRIVPTDTQIKIMLPLGGGEFSH